MGTNRKHGRKKEKPAFKKWKSLNASGNGLAAKRKVRRLAKRNGMTLAEAEAFRDNQMAQA